nr:MAG TPA: hypothetical protein [Caudoviricetes sp.]
MPAYRLLSNTQLTRTGLNSSNIPAAVFYNIDYVYQKYVVLFSSMNLYLP